jgi:protocatechuate 3,4-dioxygenase beta subunit
MQEFAPYAFKMRDSVAYGHPGQSSLRPMTKVTSVRVSPRDRVKSRCEAVGQRSNLGESMQKQVAIPRHHCLSPSCFAVLCFLLTASLAQEPSNLQESAPTYSPETTDTVYRVTGRVIDDLTGNPLSGATVRLAVGGMVLLSSCANCDSPPPPPPELEPPRENITGKDGSFAFDNVRATGGSVTASKPGYMDVWRFRRRASEPPGGRLISNQTGPVILRLAPAASISGILLDHNGTPITKNADITLWQLADWAGWPRLEYGGFPEFAADGTYHFHDLLPGRYYLVADPPVNREGPARNAAGHAVGEVPVRYPAPTSQRPNPFFTLHEGEQAHLNFRLPQRMLHRVTGTVNASQPYSYDIVDANGSKAYLLKGSPFEKPFEAWLPNGSYRLSTGREDVTGPLPFEVADSDLAGMLFSIAVPERVEIPVEISSLVPHVPTCLDSTPVCGFAEVALVRFLPGGYVEVVSESRQAGRFDGTSPQLQTAQSVSLIPGIYSAAVAVTLNVYVKSIVSGSTDLAVEPLIIRAGDSPEPIRIVLAEGAIVDGVVHHHGKPVMAWVYAVAEDIEPKSDFREFQPVLSDEDGKFHMQGLAPGSYLFFASDIELSLNVHDSAETAYWRSRGKILRVEPGKTTDLVLTVTDSPEEQ